jgi:predicted SnoaL-like aldol condensation-catalyzing enzyme
MKSKAISLIAMALFGSGLGACLPAMARAQEAPIPHGCSVTPAELQAEKRIVLDFFRPGITLRDLIALVDPSYIQHNPLVLKLAREKHTSDYEEFKLLFTQMAASGNPGGGDVFDGPARRGGRAPQVVFVTAECDLVTAIIRHTPPDPTAPPGTTYERFAFDTFRVRGGKLVEHWTMKESRRSLCRRLRSWSSSRRVVRRNSGTFLRGSGRAFTDKEGEGRFPLPGALVFGRLIRAVH